MMIKIAVLLLANWLLSYPVHYAQAPENTEIKTVPLLKLSLSATKYALYKEVTCRNSLCHLQCWNSMVRLSQKTTMNKPDPR